MWTTPNSISASGKFSDICTQTSTFSHKLVLNCLSKANLTWKLSMFLAKKIHDWLFSKTQRLHIVEIVFCCIVFPVSTFVEKFESMRKNFPCYQDHKKWTKGKFCQPEAAGRGLVMFPRFTFCDRDNMEKLFEYFQIYLRRCMKQEKQCNRVLFFIFPVFSLLDQWETGKIGA